MIKPNQQIRVRIAPSPTGPLHIGTVRTALFNWLFAKKYRGSFILRIEDTDLERSDKKYEKDIIENLKWLGLDWDEGIEVGGEYAPYRQSERIYTYSKYIERLLKEKKAFYCFHTLEELEQEKKEQFKKKEAPRHICEHFEKPPKKDISKAIIRFKAPKKLVKFHDLIRGEIEFNSELLGDISIAKSVGIPLYNFAVSIDDFEMKITHVIRGEDHISNTPKQILIQEALEFPQPEYAHLPLILGPDKSKLSKRHGALSISWYRDQGYLPETMLNFVAFLGWNPGNEQEFFSQDELIKEFSLEKVQKSGAIFNINKLEWMNGHYIRSMGLNELAKACIPFLDEKLKTKNEKRQNINFAFIKKIVKLEQERMRKLSEIGELADFFFKDKLEYDKTLLQWKNMTNHEISVILDKLNNILSDIKVTDWSKKNLHKILATEAKRVGDPSTSSGQDIGKVFWPFRVALTGKKASPDPIDIAVVLGKEQTLKRIKHAKSILEG